MQNPTWPRGRLEKKFSGLIKDRNERKREKREKRVSSPKCVEFGQDPPKLFIDGASTMAREGYRENWLWKGLALKMFGVV